MVTMSRSFDWDNDTCRPVLGRAHLLTIDVNWDEFHAWLFVPQEADREFSIEVQRNPRNEMHAHILASPSSAEELRKHLTELNAFRNFAEEAER